MQYNRYLVKLFLVFCILYQVSCSPTAKDLEEGLSTGAKRDATSGAAATSSLLRSALFNPYLYPPFIPSKPYLYPLLTPSDILLNRFAKSTPTDLKPSSASASTSLQTPKSYFKTKKDEFLVKLFEKLNNASETTEISTRSVSTSSEDPDESVKSTIDPSFFINKKLDFLEKLFKTLNNTPTAASATMDVQATVTTPKPTIVPANFWFPFLKPPKPPKAPKPTKPPKAKKILKDALEMMILQSLLSDMGIDPNNGTLSKRASTVAGEKKMKSKKPKSEEDTDFHIPAKVDPSLYSTKASDCLDKLFKILSKADEESLTNFIEPKATVVPNNLWTQPSDTEYTSKLDAFLDLLLKSLNATENSKASAVKVSKSKKPDFLSKKLKKRATFIDELLHRIPPTSTTAEPDPSDCDCSIKTCCCDGSCTNNKVETATKDTRSLIFKPFGTGYWIPQYLYAAKMGLYLDKLMNTINIAAAEDVSTDSTSMKRSLTSGEGKINITGLPAKESALALLIAELIDVKNEIVDAFGDGVKAQKDTSMSKPFNSGAKSFKKPFWGPKPSPTTDPVEPIQKRIDILNNIFDKLTEVEKALIFSDDLDDSKLFKNQKDNLGSGPKIGNAKADAFKTGNIKVIPQESFDSQNAENYIEKTRDFLQTLYNSKVNNVDGEDDKI